MVNVNMVRMAKAFYPTNDGHIGNIEKYSLPELMDLINRQASLLKKRNFINTLPDKGKKIKDLLDKLNEELDSRKLVAGQISRDIQENINHVDADGADEIEKGFDRLNVRDTENVTGSSVDDKPKHMFEIAEERAKQNATDMRQYTRLNQSLKVSTVQELPADIKALQPEQNRTSQKSVISEESAAVNPNYKFNEAQIIPLDESLHLQKSQKEKLEQIQAFSAAQKLTCRPGIKMEKYNPEGVDMSYRGATADPDSESDTEEMKSVDFYDEADDVD